MCLSMCMYPECVYMCMCVVCVSVWYVCVYVCVSVYDMCEYGKAETGDRRNLLLLTKDSESRGEIPAPALQPPAHP